MEKTDIFHLKAISGHIIEFSLKNSNEETIQLSKNIASGKFLFVGLFKKDNNATLKAMILKLAELKGFDSKSFGMYDNNDSHIIVAKTATLRRDKRTQIKELSKELQKWKTLYF